MRRFLHVVRSLRSETGGLAAAVRQLCDAQRRWGSEVRLVSLDPADAAQNGVTCLGRTSHGYGFAPDYVPWLRANAINYDAVIIHGLWQYQSFGAWRVLRRGSVPYLVFPHGMLDRWFKRAHPLKHLKKWLYWPWGEYRVLRDAAAVCFTTPDERDRSVGSFWLYHAHERIAPLGIAGAPIALPEAQAAFRKKYPEIVGGTYLLFLGRIHPKKGIEILLRSYAKVYAAEPRSPLVVAGPCDNEAFLRSLRQEADRLGIASAVHWLGMLEGPAKWGALSGCEAFVLFSHQENFGVAVVEALACARPVLLSDQIAISRDLEADGAAIVAPDTMEGAGSALGQWRARSPAQRAAMADAARASFTRRYDINSSIGVLDEILNEYAPRA